MVSNLVFGPRGALDILIPTRIKGGNTLEIRAAVHQSVLRHRKQQHARKDGQTNGRSFAQQRA